MGPQWGHGRLPVRRKSALGFEPSPRCADFENAVRGVLREPGRRALEPSLRRSVARRGDIDHLVARRAALAVIEAETRRFDDRHLVRARDTAYARPGGSSGAADLSARTARDHHPGRPAGPGSCTAGDGRPAGRPGSHTLRQLSCLRSPVGPANWTAPVAAKAKAPAPPLGRLAIVFRAKQSCGARESAPLHSWRAMAARASATMPLLMQPRLGRRSRARRGRQRRISGAGQWSHGCAARRSARRRLKQPRRRGYRSRPRGAV